mgnify:CR=1 FL=1
MLNIIPFLVQQFEIWFLRNLNVEIFCQYVISTPNRDRLLGVVWLVYRLPTCPDTLFEQQFDGLINMKQGEFHVHYCIASKVVMKTVIEDFKC